MKKTTAIVLAGGEGSRLQPLVDQRAKPAVPFAGVYRLIDFILLNLQKSGISQINITTQTKADSLLRHIERHYVESGVSSRMGHYTRVRPAQLGDGSSGYLGTADAVYQNLSHILEDRSDFIAIFGADTIFKMDISQMLEFHQQHDADITIASLPTPIDEAKRFGVISITDEGRILSFDEKPENPQPIPHNASLALCSMGNYIFKTGVLQQILASREMHDLSKHVVPRALKENFRVFAYDFLKNTLSGVPNNGYWKDVGTIASYFEASMDLLKENPLFDLYDDWMRSMHEIPPARVFQQNEHGQNTDEQGNPFISLISPGCDFKRGSFYTRSILSPYVVVGKGSIISNAILFDNVIVGNNCRIHNVIIDKSVKIPDGMVIDGRYPEALETRIDYFKFAGDLVAIPKRAQVRR